MSKKGQYGSDAVWGGPHTPSNLKKGNPRYGMDPMQVLKADLPYKAGPISSIAKRLSLIHISEPTRPY